VQFKLGTPGFASCGEAILLEDFASFFGLATVLWQLVPGMIEDHHEAVSEPATDPSLESKWPPLAL
jgi:hypothetical protein